MEIEFLRTTFHATLEHQEELFTDALEAMELRLPLSSKLSQTQGERPAQVVLACQQLWRVTREERCR